jgi:hypothetical protein
MRQRCDRMVPRFGTESERGHVGVASHLPEPGGRVRATDSLHSMLLPLHRAPCTVHMFPTGFGFEFRNSVCFPWRCTRSNTSF